MKDNWIKFDYERAIKGDGYNDELCWICYKWQLDGKPHHSVEPGWFEFYRNQPDIEDFEVNLISGENLGEECIIQAIKPILTPDLPDWLETES